MIYDEKDDFFFVVITGSSVWEQNNRAVSFYHNLSENSVKWRSVDSRRNIQTTNKTKEKCYKSTYVLYTLVFHGNLFL